MVGRNDTRPMKLCLRRVSRADTSTSPMSLEFTKGLDHRCPLKYFVIDTATLEVSRRDAE